MQRALPRIPESMFQPTLSIVSTDPDLRKIVSDIAAAHDVVLETSPDATACVIDPAAGLDAIHAFLDTFTEPPRAAIVRRASAPSALLIAMRRTRGRLVGNPRTEPHELQAFLADTFAVPNRGEERRAYPRLGVSGVILEAPAGAEFVDLSPYGAQIRVPGNVGGAPIVHLKMRVARLGKDHEVVCHVAGHERQGEDAHVRLRFVRIEPELQQELFRIAKSQILCNTIEETFRRCEAGDVEGYRRILGGPDTLATLRTITADRSQAGFARMHAGRMVMATLAGVDEASRQVRVEIDDPRVLGAPGQYICYSTTARHESYLLDGYVLSHGEGTAALSLPLSCVATDQRAQDRVWLGLDSPLKVRVGERSYPVIDLSPRGLSFYVPEGASETAEQRYLDARFELEDGTLHREAILVRHCRSHAHGHTIGATFLGEETPRDTAFVPLVEEEFDGSGAKLEQAKRAYHGERVTFAAGTRPLVGLWSETRRLGPATVVIVPPAWAKTKESTSLLSQFLCSTMEANHRHVAVLRLDFSNTLGESFKEEAFRQAGKEALGLTFSACVEDIRAAIDYAHKRLGSNVRATVLVGMSFSGPLCLRAAADDRRVTALVELMGASDIQDLVRTASGGVDYVSKHRGGLHSHQQNVLGMLADTDKFSADGIRSNLVFLQDSQADAARLRIPITWIHGRFDAFVNPARIRSILDSAPTVERRLVVVPCGHIPTKSSEAITSFLPVARAILAHTGESQPSYAVPTEQQYADVSGEEWKRAPKALLASPQSYWKNYMLGENEGALGFDVLTMTREYHELMERQIALVTQGRAKDVPVHDVGGGMGHSLGYLARAVGAGAKVELYDLVPQLLGEARRKADSLGIDLGTREWDAMNEAPPESLGQAQSVLMSLFLSVLDDAGAFLRRVAARLPVGARVVASSIRPDADLSAVYTQLLNEVASGAVPPPDGMARDRFMQEVRDYMNSAAWLLRLADEGTFKFFEEADMRRLFEQAGFRIVAAEHSFGSPARAVIVVAEKSA